MNEEWRTSLQTHRAQQRRSIQHAAVELSTERGVSGVAMVDVARRAGISRATLYKYFPGVESILASFVIDEIEREHTELEQRLARIDDPLERLREVLSHLMHYFASPGHLGASTEIDPHRFSPEVATQVGSAMARIHATVRDQLAQAIERGALRDDAELEVVGEVFGHLLSAGRALVVEHHHPPDRAGEMVWDLFLRGAGPTR